MEPAEELDLERRIHALLCGAPDEAESRQVLHEIADSPAAQQTLREMLLAERAARAAFGFDAAQGTLEASRAALLRRLKPDAAHAIRPARGGRTVGWLARVAAGILIGGISATLAAYATVRIMEHPSPISSAGVPMTAISRAEIEAYGRVWRQVVEPGIEGVPWLVLSGARGEFGYVPGEAGAERLLLVRCRFVGPGNETMETVNLILPAEPGSRLALPDAGLLGGRPVGYEVAAGTDWAAVALTVGQTAQDSAGVRGRVAIGADPVEVGEFRLNGRPVRLWLQVVPFAGAVG
ncbi:MAG TPA: hypothetical protein VMY35_16845 [Phycisphaerae bacterium]|nr:hypothetical protein [Phycisphaerae bacterium]